MRTEQLTTPVTIGDAEASAVRASIANYVLGNSAQEQKRLRLQASFLEKWTEQFLLSAALERGCACSTSAAEWATSRCSPPSSLERQAT